MSKCTFFFLLSSSFALVADVNANFGLIMMDAVIGQEIRKLPLFVLAIAIAVFFIFIRK